MRLLVCGGREFTDRPYVYITLNAIHRKTPITCIITGGANGADRLAAEWALDHNIDLVVMQAHWQEAGRAAGHKRNYRMLRDGNISAVIAFPGGRGTADMIEQAKHWHYEIPIRCV